MTGALRIAGVTKRFGATPVLRGVDLAVEAGTVTAIVGPSGCGKTTLLRVVAGFESSDAGTVTISGRTVSGAGQWVPSHRRALGYVAQDGALFPHLTVEQNVAFGLSGWSRRHRARVAELLELVNLDAGLLKRRPHELSGGQQQRVSLARALAPDPDVVLLDEPFSALDAGLRGATRTAVAQALAVRGVTTVLVTHDHGEALSFAHQVGVMIDGRLRQVGSPHEVYNSPVDLATARMVGEAIALPAQVCDHIATCVLGPVPVDADAPDGPVTIVLRPEQIRLVQAFPMDDPVVGLVERVEFLGSETLTTVRLTDGTSLRSRSTESAPVLDSNVGLQVRGTARVLAADHASSGARWREVHRCG